MKRLGMFRNRLLGFGLLLTTILMFSFLFAYHLDNQSMDLLHADTSCDFKRNQQKSYDRNTPLIFVGGWPRSGTTLMRVMLDAHPDVRCGEETHIIPEILNRMMAHRRPNNTSGLRRLLEAGITEDVLFSAVSSFILEVIVGHAEPAKRLCNKDPFTASHAIELNQMFPAAQFVHMVRDGRAVCHSVSSRHVGIGTLDHKNVTSCLISWNNGVDKMHSSCKRLGVKKCLTVHYEQLVLHTRSTLSKILEFLNVFWDDAVLHHERQINKPGGPSLSRLEPSTDQVIKPVNLESLTKWANFTPEEVKRNIREIAPMLEQLGYDPDAYPPNYGQADKEIEDNTLLVKQQEKLFQQLAFEARNRSKISDH